MAVQRNALIWSDANGVTRQTVLTTNGDPSTLLTDLQAISWSQIMQVFGGSIRGPIGLPALNAYQSVKMAASLQFQTAAGTIVRLTVPAPVLLGASNPTGIFKADKITVDPAQIGTVITDSIGLISDLAGNTAVAYIGGTLEPARNDLPPVNNS